MSVRWASPRFRRRFLWIGVPAALVSAGVIAAVVTGNAARPLPDTRRPGTPWIYHAPQLAHLTSRERVQLLQTSLEFVRSAVARRHLDRAYALASPELRQGMSRREWETGNIPVVPFPAVGVAAWNVAYAYRDDVALQLSLIAKPGLTPVVGKTFTIELKRARAGSPWLVASWFPTGLSGQGNTPGLAAQNTPPPYRAPLGLVWLLVPVGVLALIVVVPAALALRSWLVGRRVEREYRAERSGLA